MPARPPVPSVHFHPPALYKIGSALTYPEGDNEAVPGPEPPVTVPEKVAIPGNIVVWNPLGKVTCVHANRAVPFTPPVNVSAAVKFWYVYPPLVQVAPAETTLFILKVIIDDEDVVAEAAKTGERLILVRMAKATKPKTTFMGRST
jgi:hypothetical protein